MLEFPCSEPTSRVGQLERPKEVRCLLEVWSHGDNLMHQILHTYDAISAQIGLNDLIVSQRDALLVNFAIASLVDQIADCLDRWITVGDIGLDDLQHFRGGFGEFDENAVIDLEETEELKDLARLRCDLVDTVSGY